MKKTALFLIFSFILIFSNPAHAAELRNEHVRQEGNKVVFEFDLAGDEDEAEISLTVTVDGKTYSSESLHMDGDKSRLRVGKRKRIVWHVLQDFPRGLNGEIKWKLTAKGIPSVGVVPVKGGCFQMGNSFDETETDNKPVHEVCVDSFSMGKFETTVAEFRKFANETGYKTDAEKDGCLYWKDGQWEKNSSRNWKSPGFPVEDHQPVVCVSWNDASAFTKWLSAKTGKLYLLPTEAQWEFAARSGGRNKKWAGTDRESSLGEYAWYGANAGNKAHFAGQKKHNAFGIYDMSGNVWEWTSDRYDANYYNNSPKDNPKGPSEGGARVLRGGSWIDKADKISAVTRLRTNPEFSCSTVGFRYVRVP